MDEIILLGSGGHTKACIDVIESENRFKIAGLIERDAHERNTVLGYPIIGTDVDLPRLVKQYQYAFIAVGQVSDSLKRRNIYKDLILLGFNIPNIISPTAYVSKYAKLGSGTIIMHSAVVNADAQIGSNCIINNRALIEHDVTIDNHCHVSTGAIINGHSRIGEGSFVGSSAVINQCVEIVSNCVIGSCTVVTKSIPEEGIYVGNPFRKIH
jgi:sugar O-acyltransferase (sialic acid O-acetyltransferase NeuD family)